MSPKNALSLIYFDFFSDLTVLIEEFRQFSGFHMNAQLKRAFQAPVCWRGVVIFRYLQAMFMYLGLSLMRECIRKI